MWLRSLLWIILKLVSPVKNLFGRSSIRFTLRNFIRFRVSLVFGITSIFGFSINICVGMCIISVFFKLHPLF